MQSQFPPDAIAPLRLLGQLGEGGFAQVYLAQDEEADCRRIVKVSKFTVDDPKRSLELSAFIDEGRVLDRLNHPQIVRMRRMGTIESFQGGRHKYMVLDYIEGHNLFKAMQVVRKRREELQCHWGDLLDPLTAVAILISALKPVAYAHRAVLPLHGKDVTGVAHRDISPGNLILAASPTERGNIFLIDFGSAKSDLEENPHITINSTATGTVPYMSKARLQKPSERDLDPQTEAFWREFRDTRFDVHSLGVILYELLKGTWPFPGDNPSQIVSSILSEEYYTECYEKMAAIHPDLGDFMRRSVILHNLRKPLHEQPPQFGDAVEMIESLESIYVALHVGDATPAEKRVEAFVNRLNAPHRMLPHSMTGKMPFVKSPPESTTEMGGLGAFRSVKRPRDKVLLYGGLAAVVAFVLGSVGMAWWYGGGKADSRAAIAVEDFQALAHPKESVFDSALMQTSEPGAKPEKRLDAKPPRETPIAGGAKISPQSSSPSSLAASKQAPPSRKPAQSDPDKGTSSAKGQNLPSESLLRTLHESMSSDVDVTYFKIQEIWHQYPEVPELKLLMTIATLRRFPATPGMEQRLSELKQTPPEILSRTAYEEWIRELGGLL